MTISDRTVPGLSVLIKSIWSEVRDLGSTDDIKEFNQNFHVGLREGISRIFIRSYSYYQSLDEYFSGKLYQLGSYEENWNRYSMSLIRQFEDQPLFGDDTGVTMLQICQPLRAYWQEYRVEDDGKSKADPVGVSRIVAKHIDLLDNLILNWASNINFDDNLRLLSGGPGSGKSTSTKQIAAIFSTNKNWRTIYIQLQHLPGSGPLSQRMSLYFLGRAGEPFSNESPFSRMSQDGISNWLIIFDGLDELAREGVGAINSSQEFATVLADWRSQLNSSLNVKIIVSGRAPSMQDARKRLGLIGAGTLYLNDMLPISDTQGEVKLVDSSACAAVDQRYEFWRRYAIAKKWILDPPEAIGAAELQDLTKEPLLAHLLIVSGYTSGEKWKQAVSNRNVIYSAIFEKIWNREKNKNNRLVLNEAGHDCFLSLIQSLGLAAWRGGGRTGDERAFSEMRDVYIRPDLLKVSTDLGLSELDNVAVLFYTRRDEDGGQGFEFLHKSFGEYLLASALANAFFRWSKQVSDAESDFNLASLLERWIIITGQEAISSEINTFLIAEVALRADREPAYASFLSGSLMVCESAIDICLRKGFRINTSPKFDSFNRQISYQANGLESLFAIMSALARLVYPSDKFRAEDSGWTVGPIKIVALQDIEIQRLFFSTFLRGSTAVLIPPMRYFMPFAHPDRLMPNLLSRIDFTDISFINFDISGFNFDYCNFNDCSFYHCTLSLNSIKGTSFQSVTFERCSIKYTSFQSGIFEDCIFRTSRVYACDFKDASFTECDFTQSRIKSCYINKELNASNKISRRQFISLGFSRLRRGKPSRYEWVEQGYMGSSRYFLID